MCDVESEWGMLRGKGGIHEKWNHIRGQICCFLRISCIFFGDSLWVILRPYSADVCFLCFLGYFWKGIANPTTYAYLDDLSWHRILSIRVGSGFPPPPTRTVSFSFSPVLHPSLPPPSSLVLVAGVTAVVLLVKFICCCAHYHSSLFHATLTRKRPEWAHLSWLSGGMFVFPGSPEFWRRTDLTAYIAHL